MAQTKTNLPLSASQPFKGDISTLQIKGHFYFALTVLVVLFGYFFGQAEPARFSPK